MVLAESPVIPLLGITAALVTFGGTYRDANRVEVARPLLWATITSVPVLAGFGLYLYVSAPMLGVIMTANTGLMLYGFEREVTTEEDEPFEPGTLPTRK